MTKQQRKFVMGSERKTVARPQPPMRDRRTKRERTRGAQLQRALREQ